MQVYTVLSEQTLLSWIMSHYSGDLNNAHLNSGDIWIVDIYMYGIQNICSQMPFSYFTYLAKEKLVSFSIARFLTNYDVTNRKD